MNDNIFNMIENTKEQYLFKIQYQQTILIFKKSSRTILTGMLHLNVKEKVQQVCIYWHGLIPRFNEISGFIELQYKEALIVINGAKYLKYESQAQVRAPVRQFNCHFHDNWTKNEKRHCIMKPPIWETSTLHSMSCIFLINRSLEWKLQMILLVPNCFVSIDIKAKGTVTGQGAPSTILISVLSSNLG